MATGELTPSYLFNFYPSLCWGRQERPIVRRGPRLDLEPRPRALEVSGAPETRRRQAPTPNPHSTEAAAPQVHLSRTQPPLSRHTSRS